jgi:hypothetical protein
MEQEPIAWEVIALGGLAIYLFGRWSARSQSPADLTGFGVWVAPRWMIVLFGGKRGRVRLDIASLELMSLTWCIAGIVGWLTQPTPRSTLGVLLALPIVGAILLMGAAMLVVAIGRRGRR